MRPIGIAKGTRTWTRIVKRNRQKKRKKKEKKRWRE